MRSISKCQDGSSGSVILLATASALAIIALAAPASAQNRSAAANANEGEIIVTAQRREQRLSDVPLSVSAVTATDIARRGLVSQGDYLRSLPGVNQIEAGAANSSIIIRGVAASPQNTDRGAKATVGYYLNDIPLTGYVLRGGADVKLVDLERVEVIRGPQGTLFGSGSLGGTVRNIARAPNPERLEGHLRGTISQTGRAGSDNEAVEAVVNVPIIENKVALRAVGYLFENSGFVDNVAASTPAAVARANLYGIPELARNDKGVGRDRYIGGRIALLAKPTEDLKGTITYLRQDITQHGLPDAEPAIGKFRQARLGLSDNVGGGSERLEDVLKILNATLDYSFDWGALTSSSSLVKETYLEKREIGTFFANQPPVAQRNVADTEAFIQELRFASKFAGPFQLLTGLYYENIDRDFLNQNLFGGRTNLALSGFPSATITNNFEKNSVTQKAVFGEASLELSQFKLTVGARHFDYDDRTITTNRVSGAVTRLSGSNSGTTYKANMSWQPKQDLLLYGQFSQGFRLGSPVAPAIATCDRDGNGVIDGTTISAGPRTLDPDKLESFEAGAKFTTAGGALTVNAAAYHNKWKGVPINVIVPCGANVADNAGEARTQGIEFSAEARPARGLQLSFSAAYTDAELSKDAPRINGLKGDRLPGSPRYTAFLGVGYEFELGGRKSFVRADYSWIGGFFNNLKQTGIEAGDYSIIGARIGTRFGPLGVEAFVSNLTNSAKPTWVDSTFTGPIQRLYRLRPRTIGLTGQFSF
ncbi:TonB-dependent receptor [Rhizorhabdus dicambivorans]|nr:TonB-dependent receptor [Rhizorhabdus dicambivorans]